VKVVFGGHWTDQPGWSVLTEQQQDITKPLRFGDATLEAIFTEHVLEHVTFAEGVGFLREALRVLKPGAPIRVVAPMSDAFDFPTDEYARTSLRPWFSTERRALQDLGMDLEDFSYEFMLNSMFRLHAHKFIWSREMLATVLTRLGFTDVNEKTVGVSDYGIALERRLRGVEGPPLTAASNLAVPAHLVSDPESGVVEARKP
jgi:SAM-dependent methyltransferase